MSYPVAIVIASVVIGLSAVVTLSPSHPHAQSGSGYAIAAADGAPNNVWRMDRGTGKVSYCFAGGPNAAPKCTPWSE